MAGEADGSAGGTRARHLLALAAAIVVMMLPSLARAAGTGDASHFRRGASVFSMLGWGDLAPGDPDHYATEPFAKPTHAFPEALLRGAARAGFDFIRLSVDPGPFLQLTGPARDRLDALLVRDVERLRALGFAVIVDLHPDAQIPAYNSFAFTGSIDGAGFRSYADLVRRTARVLDRFSGEDVALELMNEPPNKPDPRDTARWQAMLEALHAAARAAAPRLLLVLAGAQADLPALDPAPFRGSAVLYTFHYYEPHDFTHQGVPYDDHGRGAYRRYLSGLPYPSILLQHHTGFIADNVDGDASLDPEARSRVLAAALAKATAYGREGYDRQRIARDFDAVGRWASSHGIPPDRIILGEFGVSRSYEGQTTADPLSAEAWLRDVRTEAEAHGFGWAVWALIGGSFMRVTVEDGSPVFDPGTLAALGLRDPERANR